MTKVKIAVDDPAELVAVTVKSAESNVPVGVPLMTQVISSIKRPEGSSGETKQESILSLVPKSGTPEVKCSPTGWVKLVLAYSKLILIFSGLMAKFPTQPWLVRQIERTNKKEAKDLTQFAVIFHHHVIRCKLLDN